MDKIFVDGFFFEEPHQNAPDFIKARVSFNLNKFKKFLADNKEYLKQDNFLNMDLLEKKNGGYYLQLNTYKKEESTKEDDNEKEVNVEEIPF